MNKLNYWAGFFVAYLIVYPARFVWAAIVFPWIWVGGYWNPVKNRMVHWKWYDKWWDEESDPSCVLFTLGANMAVSMLVILTWLCPSFIILFFVYLFPGYLLIMYCSRCFKQFEEMNRKLKEKLERSSSEKL